MLLDVVWFWENVCIASMWCISVQDLCGDVAMVQGEGIGMAVTRHIVNHQGLCGIRQVRVVSFLAGKV